jgi:hypothetical protein
VSDAGRPDSRALAKMHSSISRLIVLTTNVSSRKWRRPGLARRAIRPGGASRKPTTKQRQQQQHQRQLSRPAPCRAAPKVTKRTDCIRRLRDRLARPAILFQIDKLERLFWSAPIAARESRSGSSSAMSLSSLGGMREPRLLLEWPVVCGRPETESTNGAVSGSGTETGTETQTQTGTRSLDL